MLYEEASIFSLDKFPVPLDDKVEEDKYSSAQEHKTNFQNKATIQNFLQRGLYILLECIFRDKYNAANAWVQSITWNYCIQILQLSRR